MDFSIGIETHYDFEAEDETIKIDINDITYTTV
jgi:hypothetical protein